MKRSWKVLLAIVILTIAYYGWTRMVEGSDESASAVIPNASPWNYEEEADPVTKKTKARTTAKLHIQTSAGEAGIADVIWDCSDGTTESLKLEINTFLDATDKDGKLKPLEQDEAHAIDYRFDGVATSISSQVFGTGATIRREYRNSVQLFLIAQNGLYGRYRYPGLYVTTLSDFMYKTKAFYIVDPEFVARIPTSGGANVVIQFSLEDPAIKKILTQCGLTYGPVPIKKTVKNREMSSAIKTDISNNETKPANSINQAISTNVRVDPNHPLKIGPDYYPEASLKAGEEGRCVVKVTVSSGGMITDEILQTSTGFPRLDEACLTAVRGQRLIPATENGKPIERNVSIPIVWTAHATQ